MKKIMCIGLAAILFMSCDIPSTTAEKPISVVYTVASLNPCPDWLRWICGKLNI